MVVCRCGFKTFNLWLPRDKGAESNVLPVGPHGARRTGLNASDHCGQGGALWVAAGGCQANGTQTHVCCQGDVVVGFYSLAVGCVEPEAAPSRVMKGLARHPVPIMILGRLAVVKEHQRKGQGQTLLKDTLQRTAQGADIAGIRFLSVPAKEDAARLWYESWVIEASPTDPYHLFQMFKDLKGMLS